ncbi:unnamed protein product [Meloidogyne enterolobii]|uniref:Uncharacterized protein n=1 Tax=Meloidogyne enterolobii TaxID=390850 RepID=A0ACB0ZM62_MELEN
MELGPLATNNELRRQLYVTEDTIDGLDEVNSKLKSIFDKGRKVLSNWPVTTREKRWVEFNKRMKELGVRALSQQISQKLKLWKKRRWLLHDRLQIPQPEEHTEEEVQNPQLYMTIDRIALNETNRTFPCRFCDNQHRSIKCRTFNTAEERRVRASERRICFICLQQGHEHKNCSRRRDCAFCGNSQHNAAFCEKLFKNTDEEEYLENNEEYLENNGDKAIADPKKEEIIENAMPFQKSNPLICKDVTVKTPIISLGVGATNLNTLSNITNANVFQFMELQHQRTLRWIEATTAIPTQKFIMSENIRDLVPEHKPVRTLEFYTPPNQNSIETKERVGPQTEVSTEIYLKNRNNNEKNIELSTSVLLEQRVKLEKVRRSLIAHPKILKRKTNSRPRKSESEENRRLLANKTIPVRQKSNHPNNLKQKKRVGAQLKLKNYSKPLEANSPIVFLCDERALELRNVIKEENLRGLVFEPSSWDSQLFRNQILLRKVDTLVVWKQSIDKGLLEVLREANSLKSVVRKIIWIVPLEGIEIPSLKNITAVRKPTKIQSLLIKLAILGTPLMTRETKEKCIRPKEKEPPRELNIRHPKRKKRPLVGENKNLETSSLNKEVKQNISNKAEKMIYYQNNSKKHQLDGANKPRLHREFYPSKRYGTKENRSGQKDQQCSLGSLSNQYSPRTFYPSKLNHQELYLNSKIKNRPLEGTAKNFRFYREFYPSKHSSGVRANNIKVSNMDQSHRNDGLDNGMQQKSWNLATSMSGNNWFGEK